MTLFAPDYVCVVKIGKDVAIGHAPPFNLVFSAISILLLLLLGRGLIAAW